MNVFIYYGNVRDCNSKAYNFILELERYLKDTNEFKNIIIRTADNMELNFMNNWSDVLFDNHPSNREVVKKEIINSNLIIFISPVFLHNVSAYTKLFLDNFAAWAHVMPLIGKIGFPISLSSNNGNQFVNDYLKKIMNYWGIITLKPISLELSSLSKESISSYVRFICNNSILALEDIFSIEHSCMNEIYRTNYNNVIKYEKTHPEKILFDKLGYSTYSQFEDVLRFKLSQSNSK